MSSHCKLSEANDVHLEAEEDEDEDVDFNPFLQETHSPEASSSLSSENEGLGADLVDNVGSSSVIKETSFSSKVMDTMQGYNSRDSENDEEEVVMQTRVSTSGKESGDAVMGKSKKRKSTSNSLKESGSIYLEGNSSSKEFSPEKENSLICGKDIVEVDNRELPHSGNSIKTVMELDDDEDAICKRTRARYSLANFTLEELETFLQETDDDDDLQNVDDEQEYRKFLAAVLQGGDDEGQRVQENANVEDEDEENDADFEIEIEEALDSDLDEMRDKGQKEKYGVEGRRPETRQNRRQRSSVQNKKFLGQANRPLRPLLPSISKAPLTPFPSLDGQKLKPDSSHQCSYSSSSSAQDSQINGFAPYQIGQLHCLIHEHVQLLLQVFSLCVLDPSRQHIAGEVKQMISEVVRKRDEVSQWRKVPYPGFCFRPPYTQPSVSDGIPNFLQLQCPVDSSSQSDPPQDCSSANDKPVSQNAYPSDGRNTEHVQFRHMNALKFSEGSLWVPLTSGPILSILDVAPLSLVGRYMTDVAKAVQAHQQRYAEAIPDSHFERQPLFPLPNFPLSAESNNEVLRGAPSPGTGIVSSALPCNQQPKKTLAAALVESSKKQSVALVPKEIVKLAQRFYPLFNSALFPHKPPPASVVNRVLFTDAEDELLAMGMMEYNTDWKEIQQRFLPCKSKHQIFVRQKNRCSSKAPENPIKAVRKMKTSPLTAEEKARIDEGLRVLKLDWMSVWKSIVPYRDPSLLPRQWRIALGTQKSYKSDAAKKEKRRLYELQRRKCKAAASSGWQTASEKEDYLVDNVYEENNSGNDNVEDEDEAYVHEAFLADWRPENSSLMSSELPQSSVSRRDLQPGCGGLLPQEGACVGENAAGNEYGESRSINGYIHESFSAPKYSQHSQNVSHITHITYSASYSVVSNHLGPDSIPKSSKSPVSLRPYRGRRRKGSQLVKLAPDLPPVNLPPSVRVISQSAFKSYHCGSSYSTKVSSSSAGTEDLARRLSPVASSGITCSVNAQKKRNTPSCPLGPRFDTDQCVAEEKGSESELQMHPLLFQSPEDGSLPYQGNHSTSSSTYNFLPGNQLQANLNLLPKSPHVGSPVNNFYTSLSSREIPSSTSIIDFHPLLQRAYNVNKDSVNLSSDGNMSVDMESFGGKFSQLRNSSGSVLTEPQVDDGTPATGPESASPNEKANELDLEFHLSSTSRKEKDIGSRNVTENSLGAHAVVLARNNVCDQSLPEIVMEQEELSDSEEEIGEHVEFEQEEMADSEGDDSDSGQLVETQNKDVQVIMTEEVVTNEECNDQHYEPRINCDMKRNVRATTSGNIDSSIPAFIRNCKDPTNSNLEVSLDMPGIKSSTRSKRKHEGFRNGHDQAGKSLTSRPRRLSKRMMPNTEDIKPQELPLLSAENTRFVTPGRRARKKLQRNDSPGKPGCVKSYNLAHFSPDNSSPKVADDPKKAMDVFCLDRPPSREADGQCITGFQAQKELVSILLEPELKQLVPVQVGDTLVPIQNRILMYKLRQKRKKRIYICKAAPLLIGLASIPPSVNKAHRTGTSGGRLTDTFWRAEADLAPDLIWSFLLQIGLDSSSDLNLVLEIFDLTPTSTRRNALTLKF
ncbi:hypothetical protein BVC80_1101g26 [Macleaya cordata]|uniref:SANT/Myb domain n=1 Tax=Macleaya cordata TaxID=56857 RepID=A0A200QCM0_MACCD|nr:hypothetical protein BVC80_1101g26 [Macleaya cordata]